MNPGRLPPAVPPKRGRFALIPEKFLNALPKMSPMAAKVGIAIASFMSKKGECFPSREAIGKKCGVRRMKTITAATRQLQDLDVLVEKRRRNQSSKYRWVRDGAQSALSKDGQERAERAPTERRKVPH